MGSASLPHRTTGVLRAALLATAVLALPADARAEGRAIIYNFDGQASVVRNHKTVPADLDMTLHDGDVVRTEADSFVDVTLNGVVGLRLMDSSECLIVNSNEGNMVVQAIEGSFMVNMKALSEGSSFQIRMPTVTALINDTRPGTQFLARMKKTDSGPSATIVSKKNTITAVIEESSVTVGVLEGQALDVPSGNVIPPVRNATDEEDSVVSRALSIYVDD